MSGSKTHRLVSPHPSCTYLHPYYLFPGYWRQPIVILSPHIPQCIHLNTNLLHPDVWRLNTLSRLPTSFLHMSASLLLVSWILETTHRHPVSPYPPCIHSKPHSCSYVHVSIHNHPIPPFCLA